MSDTAPMINIPGAEAATLLMAPFLCFALDFATRSATGGIALNYFIINQLPVLLPEEFAAELCSGLTYAEFVVPRVLELSYTAWDLQSLAED